MQPFDEICHDTALAELRICSAPGLEKLGLPREYFLREFYCTERGCDCRRVMVDFIAKDAAQFEVAATVNYGWESRSYYRRWSKVPGGLWRQMAGASLERMVPQGPHARHFLLVFNEIIKDAEVVASFRRHYEIVKRMVDGPRGQK
jgi:hypothetical protein